MNRNLRLVVHNTIPEDETLRHQWNELVDAVDQPQVFYTYEWALAVHRAYKANMQPMLLLGYDAERLVGVTALAISPDGKRVSFLGATTGDYCDFLSPSPFKAEFVASVLSHLRRTGVRHLALANLPADSDTMPALTGQSVSKEFHCFARTGYICARALFDRLERDKKGVPYAPGLKRLRRFEKAMAPEATVRTEHRRSWDEIEPLLHEFMRAHVARFLEVGRISNLSNPDRQRFLSELGRALAGKDWLVFSRMLAGDHPVAWHLGFKFHDAWFWYQPTFDSSVEKHWPGFCLLSQVIQDALADPALKMVDLGLGAEVYKAKFANATRETLYVNLSASAVAHWKEQLRYKIAEAVKQSPFFNRMAEALRRNLNLIHSRYRREGLARTISWLWRRILRVVASREEIVFFDWKPNPTLQAGSSSPVQEVRLNDLADAAMAFHEDEATCSYLLRVTPRLRQAGCKGYVLKDSDGRPIHFAWVAPIEGFDCAELHTKLRGSADAVLIFDCWTPAPVRGRGHYSAAISEIANQMALLGNRVSIFCARSNQASIQGIEKAGFHRTHSVLCERIFGVQRLQQKAEWSGKTTVIEASAST